MKTDRAATELEVRAAEALRVAAGAGFRRQAQRDEDASRRRAAAPRKSWCISTSYGHSHTLACEVNADTRPSKVRASLKKLQDCAAHLAGETTPVLIAPYLSPEAQALCKESHAGFLDLEGNARLSVGEVFIGKRSMRQQPAA